MSAVRGTLSGRWRRAVAAVSERTFLVWEGSDGRVASWTYAEFDRLVDEVRTRFTASGVRPGDTIHLGLANSPAFVASWLAAANMSACIVPSDPRSSSREFGLQIERTRPALAVVGRESAAAYRSGTPSTNSPPIISVDEDDIELRELREAPPTDAERPEAAGCDPAAILFTSGTTSAPKGVVVTQANYAFTGDVMAAAASVTTADRLLVVLPLFHANAQYYSFAAAISAGASVALIHAFSASGFVAQAARHQATHASLFAAPMRMVLARGAAPVSGLILRHCWYAQNLTAEQYARITALFGCRPRQLYGMTETIPAVLTNNALTPQPEAMGTVTLGCDVDIQDEEGRPVPAGTAGEIVVRGRRGDTLFDGYLDDPVTTARAFRGGVFRTGDRARRDEQGHFYFEGRGGDVLKVAGENVSVVEVEAVLAAHQGVLEVAVVGADDSVRDEVPVAYVVRAAGHQLLDERALLDWCAARLSPTKRPRAVYFVDELPRTSVGKIRKFLLRSPAPAVQEAPR